MEGWAHPLRPAPESLVTVPSPGCRPRKSSPWRAPPSQSLCSLRGAPKRSKVLRRQARDPMWVGAGSGGPGRAGCLGWEDVEVGMEVSVRARAQGGENSCWSCIIKILLSGAWQSPINPLQGSTLSPLSAAAAPCSPGTSSGLALPGESRGPGCGWPWAEPGWAGMGTGEGECGQGSRPGLPPGPHIPSTPPFVLVLFTLLSAFQPFNARCPSLYLYLEYTGASPIRLITASPFPLEGSLPTGSKRCSLMRSGIDWPPL